MSANSERPELEPPASIEARYQIERTLGQGANGVVYQVLDRETGERLALKKLLRMDRVSVARLKHEFRSLANLHHPNLVKLYEMGRAEDAWFITMEHLDGQDLLMHLSQEADISSTLSLSKPLADADVGHTLGPLCGAFLQLARGIHALHRAGMLHRDLKPSNVMVVRERVVVLDFGLVHELGDRSTTLTQEESVAGTPAYMAPEQVQGEALSAASDWYAFGVMLYEAVSGRLPISGKLMELLDRKVRIDPPPLSEAAPYCPGALSELCSALLSRKLSERPGFEAISGVLQALLPAQPVHARPIEGSLSAERLSLPRVATRTQLFGRSRELAELDRVWSETTRGRLAVAHVLGPSGAGKSAVVEEFVESLEMRHQPAGARPPLVLRARCYEREAMPFKALDGVMDALVRHLLRLDELLVGHILPVHLPELARAFPALERLPSVQRLLGADATRGGPSRERQRAELALFELLRRCAGHSALVLWIDDLQWGDLDSVHILKSWIESEESLPIMLVLSYRGEEREDNACLRLLAAAEPSANAVQLEIGVSPLSASDVESLCQSTLGSLAPRHSSLVNRIVHEAHGSPFLAWQLVTLAQARIAQGDSDLAPSIGGLVSQLSALLREPERSLLNVLAVAGRPIAPKLALDAARIRHNGRSQLHALQGLGLIRMRLADDARLIEVYHDRVRESVVEAMTEIERVETHRRLLATLESEQTVDPDWLHVVAVGAHDDAAAVRYGLLAAQRAEASLAFERAADLYRDCLQRGERSAAESGALWQKLGDALAACGRGARAAEAYMEAAQHADPELATELTQKSATHLIRTGRFEQGEALVRNVLAALRISVPQSQSGLMAAIAWERGRLALRGVEFTRRDEASIDKARLREAQTYATLSIYTQAYDPLRAALFEARSLRIALELGAAADVGHALCAAATLRGVSGTERAGREAEQLLARAEQLAEELSDPLLLARVQSSRAMCAFLLGHVQQVLELSDVAEHLYQVYVYTAGRLPAEYYHRFAVNAARIGALFQLGQLRQASVELKKALQDARSSENRTAQLHLTMVVSLDDIAFGRAARARARLDTERGQLPPSGFGPLHLFHMVAVIRVACALSDFEWAEHALAPMWPQFDGSLLRHGVLAQLIYGGRARMQLNRHVLEQRTGDVRRLLQSDLRAMQRRPSHLPPAMLTRMQARVASVSGATREQVIALYRAHVQACERAAYADELARARWALGRVLASTEGSALSSEAVAALAEIGFADPERDLASHFPELA